MAKIKINTTFTINNIIVTNREIANRFNNYCISIGHLLANDIACRVNPLSYVKSIDNSIVIVNMSYSEVERVISALKNSSTGSDEIPTFVDKNVFIVILNL